MRVLLLLLLAVLSVGSVVATTFDYIHGVGPLSLNLSEGSHSLLISSNTRIVAEAKVNTTLIINRIERVNFSTSPSTLFNGTTFLSVVIESYQLDVNPNSDIKTTLESDSNGLNYENYLLDSIGWYIRSGGSWIKIASTPTEAPLELGNLNLILAGYKPTVHIEQVNSTCPEINLGSLEESIKNITSSKAEEVKTACNKGITEEEKVAIASKTSEIINNNGFKHLMENVLDLSSELDLMKNNLSVTLHSLQEQQKVLTIKVENVTASKRYKLFSNSPSNLIIPSIAIGILLLIASVFMLKGKIKRKAKTGLSYIGVEL